MQTVQRIIRRTLSTTTTSHPSSSLGGGTTTHLQQLRTSLSDVLKLSKHRLSALVAFTATAGYALRADANDVDEACRKAATTHYNLGLVSTTIGTFLTAASANTLNQVYERVSDMKMQRTKLRPLPSGRVSIVSALTFAAFSGASGLFVLKKGTDNDVATGLGFANLVLYSGVYTPLKAVWHGNTVVGALVGAIPPLIGWTAASNGKLFSVRESGAWSLASLLFLWQIPHFHALAVALRADYARAGLKMLAVSNPVSNAFWARACAMALIPVGVSFSMGGVTSESFAWEMAMLSWWMGSYCSKMMDKPVCVESARRVFKTSIVHLPLCLALLMLHHQRYPAGAGKQEEQEEQEEKVGGGGREIRLHQPWEVIAPFPFLPVPRGAPAIVLDSE